MTVTVALLQGVNVGKYKRIAMTDFKAIIAELGGELATTVANSGNVVFRHDNARTPEELRLEIERSVSDHVGVPIPTVTRSHEEMQQILAANPYPHVTDPKCLHVEFLLEPIGTTLDKIDFGDDHLTAIGREIYMHLPNNWTGATFDARALYNPLGSHHTSRNWSTVTKLTGFTSLLQDQ